MANDNLRLSTFYTASWVLALIAFVELAAVGIALGIRQQPPVEEVLSSPQIIEKIVTRYHTLPAEKETVFVEKPIYLEKEIPELPQGAPLAYDFEPPQNLILAVPPIANPNVERLVEQSRTLRIAGDSMRALLKLEEASLSAPNDANVLYQQAEVQAAMGLYDQAADYYQRVFQLGTTGAGSLYEMAALKLRDGIEQPEEMTSKFALGRARLYEDTTWENGERVILTIPVSAAPGLTLNASQLEQALQVQVAIYDQLDGVPTLRNSATSTMETQWVTPPVDWQDGGEELLRVIYEIPSKNKASKPLLGQRSYFGQVVELYFENTLIDRLASPRRLAQEVKARGEEVYFYPDNYVPADFNFENPLLPPLP